MDPLLNVGLDGVNIRHEGPTLDRKQELLCCLPVSLGKGFGGSSHIVTVVFGGTSEHLTVEVVHQTTEGTGDNLALGIEGVGSHVGDLEQHSRDEVNNLKELEIDVHMEWNLALFLQQQCK